MPQPKRKTTKADAPAETDTAPVVSLESFRPVGFDDPDVREIEMRDGVTLTVTLAHLTTRQAKQIPFSVRTKHAEAYQAAWRYILDWDIRARNPESGETIPVPAPGHPDAPAFVKQYIGEDAEPWELLEYMLDNETGSLVLSWLLNPGGMKLAAGSGKSSKSTKTGDTSTSDEASGTT